VRGRGRERGILEKRRVEMGGSSGALIHEKALLLIQTF